MPETRAPVTQADLILVRKGYELWNAGDFDGLVRTCFTEDIEWHNSPEWPGPSRLYGSSEVIAFLQEDVANIIDFNEIEIEHIDVFGDEVLISMLVHARGAGSEVELGRIPIFHVSRMRDGKVARIRAYLNERDAVEAAREAGD